MSFESELAAIRATGAKLTEQDVATIRERYEAEAALLIPYEYVPETKEENTAAENERDRDLASDFIYQTETILEYPIRVGEDSQPHSVRFFINARSNSRVAEQTNSAMQERGFAGPVRPLETVDSTSENRGTADQNKGIAVGAGAVAGFTLGAGLGVKIAGMFGRTSNMGKLAVSLGSGVVGAAAGAGLAYGAIETVQKVRTLGVIELHVAAPPVAQYSANWENKELGALAGAGELFDKDGLLSTAGGLGDLAVRGAIKAAASLPAGMGITGDLGASLDLASAKVANPYKEQLFSNMGFRQFAFNYKFTPRNESEYNQVRRIIKLFKYHMHPENDPTGLFLEYPSEFNIKYLYEGSENEHLSKISSCALTDIKITYGNQDAFTTFKNTSGAPAEINMQLAFTELETLTNDRIAEGF
ncbi:MAG: hypothetical protein QNL00_09970 [Saprospiraceae bacterium]